jgi:hypothetical protein
MKKKILGIFVVLLMITTCVVPVVGEVNNPLTEKPEVYENKKDTPPLMPRLFMKMTFIGDYDITTVQALIKLHLGKRIEHSTHSEYDKYVYIGNVKIDGKFNDWGGYAETFPAHVLSALLTTSKTESLPGFYLFEEEFTIQARYLVLYENTSYWGYPTLIGHGFFVRVS